MLKAGWDRVDITPLEPVPLAGYGHLRERMHRSVHDPVSVRAFAFEDGAVRVVLLVYDLLMVPEELYQGLKARLSDTGSRVMVHATHTHSSLGGFGRGFLVHRFAGAFRDWIPDHLVDRGERAARAAIEDLQAAEARSESSVLPGLNGNRRDPEGPMDEELTVLRLVRERDDALIVSYSAHPVIVGERDHHALSADFPGEVVRRLERDFPFAAFVQGSLGGVDVLFPDDPEMPVDRNLRLMADPIANAAANLARLARSSDDPLTFAAESWDLPGPDSRPFFDDQPWSGLPGLPFRLLCNALIPSTIRRARVRGFRLGSFAMVGTPADLGVSVGLAAKAHGRSLGTKHPVSASQCNGYIGYLHRRIDYEKPPPPTHYAMARYENTMGFFGRSMGDRVLEAACRVHEQLARPAPATSSYSSPS